MGSTKKGTIQIDAKTGGAVRKLGDVSKATAKVGTDVGTMGACMNAAGSSVEGFAKNLKAMGVLAGGAIVLGALKSGAEAISAWAEESRRAQGVFQNLAFDISGAREASLGLVSDMDLATAANQAASVGAANSAEEFAKLTEAATALALVQGIDVTQATEKLTTAIGRGSALRLDDFGIILSATEAQKRYADSMGVTAASLSDAQKKTAFMTVANEKLNEKLRATNIDATGAAFALRRLEVDAENLKTASQGGSDEVGKLKTAIANLGKEVLTMDISSYGVDLARAEEEMAKLGITTEDGITVTQIANEMARARENVLGRMAQAARDAEKAEGDLRDEQDKQRHTKTMREVVLIKEEIRQAQVDVDRIENISNKRQRKQLGEALSAQKEYIRGLEKKAIILRSGVDEAGEFELITFLDNQETARLKAEQGKSGGSGGGGPSKADRAAAELSELQALVNQAIEHEQEIRDYAQAEMDQRVDSFLEFDQMIADAEERLTREREEKAEREAKASEKRIKAQEKAAAAERKILDAQAAKYSSIAGTYSDALFDITAASAEAGKNSGEMFRQQVEDFGKSQGKQLAKQGLRHSISAIAYAAALNPVKATAEGIAAGVAFGGAATLGAVGAIAGAGGGGGGGGDSLGSSGAFNHSRPAAEDKTLGDAPVSPLEGEGSIPAQSGGGQGLVINITNQGSILAEGDLQRSIRDALRNRGAA